VRVIQRRLTSRVTSRDTQGARHHRFDRDFISPGVLRGIVLSFRYCVFSRGIRFTGAHRRGRNGLYFQRLPSVSRCFCFGVLVCYFWLLPKTILFSFANESLGWAPTGRCSSIMFVTRFTIGFGLAFELAGVVLALVRFGLITYRFMARTRPMPSCSSLFWQQSSRRRLIFYFDRMGCRCVCIRKLYLDRMANGAPRSETHRQLSGSLHSEFLFSVFAFVLGGGWLVFERCIYRWRLIFPSTDRVARFVRAANNRFHPITTFR